MALVQQILQLICHEEFSFAQVARLLEQDAWLPGLLLTYVNAPGFDHAAPITSVPRALSYLGEQEIRKFVLINGLARVSQHMPEACTRMAIARGRFCELIALTALGKAEASWAFLVGLVLDGSLLSEPLMAHLPKSVQRAISFICFSWSAPMNRATGPCWNSLPPNINSIRPSSPPSIFSHKCGGKRFSPAR